MNKCINRLASVISVVCVGVDAYMIYIHVLLHRLEVEVMSVSVWNKMTCTPYEKKCWIIYIFFPKGDSSQYSENSAVETESLHASQSQTHSDKFDSMGNHFLIR